MDTQESTKVNATEKLEEVQNELHCSICHDYFVQASTLSCSHSFCFNCIDAWRKTHTDCPVCRREIYGMAPSRALDNMVAAFVDRTNTETTFQATLQQFGAWRTESVTVQETQFTNPQPNTQQSDDSDSYDENDADEYDDWEYDVDVEDSYSDGSYDAEEEENEVEEEEEDQEFSEEEEEEDGSYYSNSDDDDDDVDEDEDDNYSDNDDEQRKRSNQNNPNNGEYWRLRGWSGRPDNWKELLHRQ